MGQTINFIMIIFVIVVLPFAAYYIGGKINSSIKDYDDSVPIRYGKGLVIIMGTCVFLFILGFIVAGLWHLAGMF